MGAGWGRRAAMACAIALLLLAAVAGGQRVPTPPPAGYMDYQLRPGYRFSAPLCDDDEGQPAPALIRLGLIHPFSSVIVQAAVQNFGITGLSVENVGDLAKDAVRLLAMDLVQSFNADNKAGLKVEIDVLPIDSTVGGAFQTSAELIFGDVNNELIGIVGGQTQDNSLSIQFVSQSFSLPHVSWGATDNVFGDLVRFPYFVRTAGTQTQMFHAAAALLRHLNVTRVVLFTSPELYTGYPIDVDSIMASTGVEVPYKASIGRNPSVREFDTIINAVRASNVNYIYVGIVYGSPLLALLDRNRERGNIVSADTVFILGDQELYQAMPMIMTLTRLNIDIPQGLRFAPTYIENDVADTYRTIRVNNTVWFGMYDRQADWTDWMTKNRRAADPALFPGLASYSNDFEAFIPPDAMFPSMIPAVVDPILAYLHAAEAMVAAGRGCFLNGPARNGSLLHDTIKNLVFNGSTGYVDFDPATGDRHCPYTAKSIRFWDGQSEGKSFDPDDKVLVWSPLHGIQERGGTFYWPDGTSTPPDPAPFGGGVSAPPSAPSGGDGSVGMLGVTGGKFGALMAGLLIAVVCLGVMCARRSRRSSGSNLANGKFIISFDDVILVELIGAGTQSKVYRGMYQGAPVAVKDFLPDSKSSQEEEHDAAMREMSILRNDPKSKSWGGRLSIGSRESREDSMSFVLKREEFPSVIRPLPQHTLLKGERLWETDEEEEDGDELGGEDNSTENGSLQWEGLGSDDGGLTLGGTSREGTEGGGDESIGGLREFDDEGAVDTIAEGRESTEIRRLKSPGSEGDERGEGDEGGEAGEGNGLEAGDVVISVGPSSPLDSETEGEHVPAGDQPRKAETPWGGRLQRSTGGSSCSHAGVSGASLNTASDLLEPLEDDRSMTMDNSSSYMGSRESMGENRNSSGIRSTVRRSSLVQRMSAGIFRRQAQQRHIRELDKLCALRHPKVTMFMGLSFKPGNSGGFPLLVTEYMPCGALKDVIANMSIDLDLRIKMNLLKDCASGMMYLHLQSPPIIHRDLKASNMLLDDRFTLKISDFGIEPEYLPGSNGAPAFSGTLEYAAPELLAGDEPSTKSDVYAFALVMWELFARREVYVGYSSNDILMGVRDGTMRPPPLPNMPEELGDLMHECWMKNPNRRPEFSEIAAQLEYLMSPESGSEISGLLDKLDREYHEIGQSNALVNRMLPKRVADALRAGKKVQPEQCDSATIFFSDVVGFTTISATLEPKDVMDMLHRLYTEFDAICESHELFKVETIGDAYMVVGSIPEYQADHTLRVAKFALDAVEAAGKVPVSLSDPALGTVCIRVGFHSGPVVASVVGDLMPRYCLFGDTVNTASRMESTSVAGHIQMSHDAKLNLDLQAAEAGEKQPFVTLARGEITVKGKGSMLTYWLCRPGQQPPVDPSPAPSVNPAIKRTRSRRRSAPEDDNVQQGGEGGSKSHNLRSLSVNRVKNAIFTGRFEPATTPGSSTDGATPGTLRLAERVASGTGKMLPTRFHQNFSTRAGKSMDVGRPTH